MSGWSHYDHLPAQGLGNRSRLRGYVTGGLGWFRDLATWLRFTASSTARTVLDRTGQSTASADRLTAANDVVELTGAIQVLLASGGATTLVTELISDLRLALERNHAGLLTVDQLREAQLVLDRFSRAYETNT